MQRYIAAVRRVVDLKYIFLIIYAVIVALLVILFLRMPTGFLPTEDQGSVQVQFRLPAGATQSRTVEVQRIVERYLMEQEARNASAVFTVSGNGGAQNSGQGFILLKDWSERKGKENGADAIIQRAAGAFRGLRDAQVFALVPPAIRGLGQVERLHHGAAEQRRPVARPVRRRPRPAGAEANADPTLASVRPSELPDNPSLRVDLDQQKLSVLGLNQADVYTTLSTAWGGRYVNDFIDRGRGQARLRAGRRGISRRARRHRAMVRPLLDRRDGALFLLRHHQLDAGADYADPLLRRAGIGAAGQAAPGTSSGEAMQRMEELAAKIPGTSVAWSGLSYQERLSSGQAPLLYGLSLLVVFLCLAALYESWTIPVAVLLVLPLGLVGAIFAPLCAGSRTTSSCRSADHGRWPRRQECDPDDRVRRAGRKAGQARARFRTRSGPHPLAADPDDQPRLHVRRAAAGAVDRRRRQCPDRDRHLGDRRHADRDHPRNLLYSLFFVIVRRSTRTLVNRLHLDPANGATLPTRVAMIPRRLILAAAVALAGCSLEPKYLRPEPPVPPSLPARRSLSAAERGGAASVAYSDIFRDPRLQSLIVPGTRQQPRFARRRRQYRRRPAPATASSAPNCSRLSPPAATVRIGDSGVRTVDDGSGIPVSTGGGTDTSYSVDLGITAFEIDLFGRVRSLSSAALSQYFATEALPPAPPA